VAARPAAAPAAVTARREPALTAREDEDWKEF
jgi:hypothetical protein